MKQSLCMNVVCLHHAVDVETGKLLFRLDHLLTVVFDRREEVFGDVVMIVHMKNVGLLRNQSSGRQATAVEAVVIVTICTVQLAEVSGMLGFYPFSLGVIGEASCKSDRSMRCATVR